MHCKLVAAILASSLCLVVTAPAWAQKNNRNQQDEKRENQRVANAQKEVRSQQGELNEAEQKLRSAMRSSNGLEATVAKAREHLRETRERVADQMAKSMGIEAALARVKDTKAELAKYAKPIVDELHKSEVWRSAKKAADDAKASVEKLREDLQLSAEDRQAKLDDLTKLMLRPSELDKQAVLDTSEGKRLDERVRDALAGVEKIRRAIPDEKVAADPAVVEAEKAIDKVEAEVKKHLQSVVAERGRVQKAQQQLLQSRQKLQQAQAADARDRNRN